MTTRMRTLTVSRLYREWGEPHRKRECVVPSIRLNGKWLSQLGIAPGQKIRVVTNGAIITLAPVHSRHLGARLGSALINANFLLNRRLALGFCGEQRVKVRRE